MIFINEVTFSKLVDFIRSPEVWRIKGAGQILWDLFLEEEEIEIPEERLAILYD